MKIKFLVSKIIMFVAIGLLLSISCFSQKIEKGTNLIKIKGVTFKEAGQALIDKGFSFEMVDSNFNTIRTTYRESTKYNGMMERYYVSIKDSILTLRGECYNRMLVGMNTAFTNKKLTVDDATDPIDYTKNKKIFNEMNEFAKSFNKPIEYARLK